ncbi:hypothetical protein RR42_s0278 [Cupriavidus basilensis]|uniref:Uncharacterized protein n=1 Tax=Cupriavidus basilensis TaxID=68895 RepID=A0A0C4YJ30_9BURK|nr:hypothetical protein RR42_s0278 [Cupriavidus basilensis]
MALRAQQRCRFALMPDGVPRSPARIGEYPCAAVADFG